jgi:hypothetical protein
VVGEDATPEDKQAGPPASPEVDVLDQDAGDDLKKGERES